MHFLWFLTGIKFFHDLLYQRFANIFQSQSHNINIGVLTEKIDLNFKSHWFSIALTYIKYI